MNINIDIVNRALEAAGQERLVEEEMTEERESTRWRLIRDIYLQVILTTLSKTTWTSRIRRAKLESALKEDAEPEHEGNKYLVLQDCFFENHYYKKDEYAYFPEGKEVPESFFELLPVDPEQPVEEKEYIENLTDYYYAYFIPYDCARPEALKDNAEYITEGNILYTNSENAVLQYVSDNRRDPSKERTEEELTEDYPEYNPIVFDPTLQECIEYQLAAKIALKITGDANLSNYLFSQAMLYEAEAKKATLEHYHSKEQGEAWWGESMGLSVEGKTR